MKFSFNSKYLIIFVQGIILGSRKKGSNNQQERHGACSHGIVQREEHQRNNDNTAFPHFDSQTSKSPLGTQNSHCHI